MSQRNVGEVQPAHVGLGLAIAREVIELHVGSLMARSEGPSRDARFELRLAAAALVLA